MCGSGIESRRNEDTVEAFRYLESSQQVGKVGIPVPKLLASSLGDPECGIQERLWDAAQIRFAAR